MAESSFAVEFRRWHELFWSKEMHSKANTHKGESVDTEEESFKNIYSRNLLSNESMNKEWQASAALQFGSEGVREEASSHSALSACPLTRDSLDESDLRYLSEKCREEMVVEGGRVYQESSEGFSSMSVERSDYMTALRRARKVMDLYR